MCVHVAGRVFIAVVGLGTRQVVSSRDSVAVFSSPLTTGTSGRQDAFVLWGSWAVVTVTKLRCSIATAVRCLHQPSHLKRC